MSKQALVTFTPLEPYFFGSELTHGDGGANYFAKGNRLPQQTTLCGALRHLLYENRYKRGPNSFTPGDTTRNDYGDLLGLSPLFLRQMVADSPRYFLRQAIDRYQDAVLSRFVLEAGADHNLFLTETTQRLLRHRRNQIQPPLTETLAAKVQWQEASVWRAETGKKKQADAWVGQTTDEVVPADDIFLEVTRPGITKNRNGIPKEGEANFYKQTAYRLATGWSFAVLATFADEVDFAPLDDYCLPIGGEKTVFAIGVQSETRTLEQLFPSSLFYPVGHAPGLALVLTADAYIPAAAWPYIATGVSATVDFRHIRTNAGVRDYGPLKALLPGDKSGDYPDQLTKSTKYSLLQRGSVLICENKEDLTTLTKLLCIDPWRKIGFNHFFTYQ